MTGDNRMSLTLETMGNLLLRKGWMYRHFEKEGPFYHEPIGPQLCDINYGEFAELQSSGTWLIWYRVKQ